MQGGDEMLPTGNRTFALPNAPVRFSFAGKDGAPSTRLVIHEFDHERWAPRIEKTEVADVTAEQLRAYEGDYYSPELRTILTISQGDGGLRMTGPSYETRVVQPPQLFREADTFFTESQFGWLRFHRNAGERVKELTLTNGRLENVRFIRLESLPALARLP